MLLWYRYYTIKNKHIKRRIGGSRMCMNEAYFSRIPPHYRNINPKKGLNIVKRALDRLILEHKGVPTYFDNNVLNHIYTIKE